MQLNVIKYCKKPLLLIHFIKLKYCFSLILRLIKYNIKNSIYIEFEELNRKRCILILLKIILNILDIQKFNMDECK